MAHRNGGGALAGLLGVLIILGLILLALAYLATYDGGAITWPQVVSRGR
jgi:hypothetical protein